MKHLLPFFGTKKIATLTLAERDFPRHGYDSFVQTSLMLFTADEEADRYLCCGLIPNSKAAKKDTNKWVQVWSQVLFVVALENAVRGRGGSGLRM